MSIIDYKKGENKGALFIHGAISSCVRYFTRR